MLIKIQLFSIYKLCHLAYTSGLFSSLLILLSAMYICLQQREVNQWIDGLSYTHYDVLYILYDLL